MQHSNRLNSPVHELKLRVGFDYCRSVLYKCECLTRVLHLCICTQIMALELNELLHFECQILFHSVTECVNVF